MNIEVLQMKNELCYPQGTARILNHTQYLATSQVPLFVPAHFGVGKHQAHHLYIHPLTLGRMVDTAGGTVQS